MIQQLIYRRAEQGYRTVARSEELASAALARRIEALSTLPTASAKRQIGASPVFSRCVIDDCPVVMLTALDPNGMRGSHLSHAYYIEPGDAAAFADGNAVAIAAFVRQYQESSRLDMLPSVTLDEICDQESIRRGCDAAAALFSGNSELLTCFLAAAMRCGIPTANRGFIGICVISGGEDSFVSENAYWFMETVLRAYPNELMNQVGYRTLWTRAEDNVRYPIFFTTHELTGPEPAGTEQYIIFDLASGSVRLPRGVELQPDETDAELAKVMFFRNTARIAQLRRIGEEKLRLMREEERRRREEAERLRREEEERLRREEEERIRLENERRAEEARLHRLAAEAEARRRHEAEMRRREAERAAQARSENSARSAATNAQAAQSQARADHGTRALREFLQDVQYRNRPSLAENVDEHMNDFISMSAASEYPRLEYAAFLLDRIAATLINQRSTLDSGKYTYIAKCAFAIVHVTQSEILQRFRSQEADSCIESMKDIYDELADAASPAYRHIHVTDFNAWMILIDVYENARLPRQLMRDIEALDNFRAAKLISRYQETLESLAFDTISATQAATNPRIRHAMLQRAQLLILLANIDYDDDGNCLLSDALLMISRDIRRVLKSIGVLDQFQEELQQLRSSLVS